MSPRTCDGNKRSVRRDVLAGRDRGIARDERAEKELFVFTRREREVEGIAVVTCVAFADIKRGVESVVLLHVELLGRPDPRNARSDVQGDDVEAIEVFV